MKDRWMDPEDKKWLGDMQREIMKDVRSRPDPAMERNLCKCGHRLSEHYMGNRAMPCSKCSCNWCTAPKAEDLRRDKAKRGTPDLHPIDGFRGGGIK